MDEAIKEINSSSASLLRNETGLIFGPTKTRAARTVSLPAFLHDLLAEHLAEAAGEAGNPSDLIFKSPTGQPVRHSNFYPRVFRPAVSRAGLPALRFHDPRHTCSSWLIADGAHPLAIKQQLGHDDIRTTLNIYGHLFPSGLEALASALDAGYRGAAN